MIFFEFIQLITCGNNSSLGAWDIDTGRKVFFMLDAHDGEEITSVAIDRPCRKVATGSRNGVVKVNRLSLSHELKRNKTNSTFFHP